MMDSQQNVARYGTLKQSKSGEIKHPVVQARAIISLHHDVYV